VRLPRVSPVAYRRITLFALVALSFIIVTGASVRLTGSGLGCSDWPTCEQGQFVAPLEFQPMVEWVNRLITGLVSLAVILAVLGSLLRTPRRVDLVWLSVGLVAGVVAQIALGAVVVLVELDPVTVIGHFLVSILLVWNAVVLHERAGHDGSRGVPIVPQGVLLISRLMVVVTLAVVVAGTAVTATGPHGGDEDAERLSTFDITEVVRVHAVLAWVLLGCTIAALAWLRRVGAPRTVDQRGAALVSAIVAQGIVGYVQYFTGVPPLLVGVHVAMSIVVWIAVLRFSLGMRAHPVRPGSPSGAELVTIAA
jgi:cytochrome c oxidase assembly protein subunit 15